MTDLRQAIQKHIGDAWNDTIDRHEFPNPHAFRAEWQRFSPREATRLEVFATALVDYLRATYVLSASSPQLNTALSKLRGVVGDDTAVWVSRAANLAAAGVDGDTLDVLGRISSTQPVTPGDLNKLAAGSIPTPRIDESDEWEECEASEVSVSDQCIRIQTRAGYEVKGKPTQVTDMGAQINDSYTIFWYDAKSIYRIPAPIVHPDPAEHPVIANIAVKKPGTGVTHRYDYATWDAQDHYECWNNDGSYYGAWEPSTISEWVPGKVIADE